ncbi:MAG: SipW-dependent-type signal peptide-containing protein [Clostridium sp.]|uniref:SipW-dependent-type signal peptide-containing protein n=1 Tax=Clostridium sp. TaxID=1506 RepID=UPI002E779B7C|nr:SipW-dependent-type signal peptide-containing protein [Clostridium sp.]MEE0131092.1 SipW-dependent-type signal peptide-containing protein [Clostridium sp.]
MKDKNKMLNKSMKFGLALLLIAILAIGATVAFFTDIEAAVNSISTGKVEVEVEEKVDGLIKSGIGVKATGTSKCYVRIRVDIPTLTYTYKDADRNAVVTYKPTEGSSVSKQIDDWNRNGSDIYVSDLYDKNGTISASWVRKEDGYWYLSTALDPAQDGCKKAIFLEAVTYPNLIQNGKLPDGITEDMLAIPIIAEAVQADNMDVGSATGADAAYAAFEKANGN